MRHRLLSLADSELAGAAQWYEAQAAGLGQEFLDEFQAVMSRIMRFPEAWARIGTRHRRCFRWEIAEVDDAVTRQRITSHHRVVFPRTPCGAGGYGRLVNFHVRRWLGYGLIRVEATGQTM